MLKKLYDKSKIWFALEWIIAYCVLMSAGDSISAMIGIEKSVTLAVGFLLSAVLLMFLRKHALFSALGLCTSKAPLREMLFYLPVIIMISANLWYGVTARYGVVETVLYILSMLCVGFLEEVIFRGLLFNALKKDGLKVAIIVSSLTFGIGHIINLVNGSGAELLPNLLQVVYATAAGFMFVMMYVKSESLIVCIAAHGLFNAISVFADESSVTAEMRILSCLAIAVITGGYASYLAWTMKSRKND